MTPERALYIYGAGGHAKVVADAFGGPVAGFIDDNPERAGTRFLDRPVLCLGDVPADAGVHVAIGDSTVRAKLSAAAEARGLALTTICHPAAVIASDADIGSGSFVAARAVLAPASRIGSGTIVNHGAVVDHDSTTGPWCHIAPNATLGGGVYLGAHVLIGANAAVLPGRRICEGCQVGAASAVIRDLEIPGTYAGSPARATRK